MGTLKLILPFLLVIIACALLKSIYNVSEGFRSTNTDNMPLYEFCTFGSMNTTLMPGRKLVDLEQIKRVLDTGCRFIDLEIYSMKGLPVVGYSADVNNKTNLDTENSLILSDVLNKIVSVGFSESPNTSEPIFIHMRIKTLNTELYNKIADIIKVNIEPRIYGGKRGNKAMLSTPLSKLMGKVVIIVDSGGEDSPDYKNLKGYIHMESGKYTVRNYEADRLSAEMFAPPIIKDNGITTNLEEIIKIVYPSNGNPDLSNLTRNFGAQIIMNRFYMPDANLAETQRIFSENKTSFIPMARMLRYLKNEKSESE